MFQLGLAHARMCYFYLLLLFMVSCRFEGVKNDQCDLHENRCVLHLVGKKEFHVNENISVLTQYIQYIDTLNLFSLYNKYDNAIYFFDYPDGKQKRKIQLMREGDNGVGLIQGYDYVNEDSIFVYNYGTGYAYMVNSEGKLLWKKSLPVLDAAWSDLRPAFPYVETDSPIVYADRKLFFCGMRSSESPLETSTNSPIMTIYDFQTDSVFFRLNYPEQYQKYSWGGGFCRRPYFTVNRHKSLAVVSFPQDHNLYVYSLQDGKQSKYYSGSRLVDRIEAYDEKKGVQSDENRVLRWFYSVPPYRCVIYDKKRDLYYRLACLSEKKNADEFISATQPIVLIVLDGQFNYIGEAVLPEDVDFRRTNCFSTDGGFFIQALTDNDDLMTFYQFKVDIHE